MDKIFLKKLISSSKILISVEENLKSGGFGSSILEFLSETKNKNNIQKIKIMGLEDKFVEKYGTQKELLDHSGLNVTDLIIKMEKCVKKK